jgi:hypothetical protein
MLENSTPKNISNVKPSGERTKEGEINVGKQKKKQLRGFGPQANYADRATAACRRS